MAYEVYYWGACADFYGRALSPLLILETSADAPVNYGDFLLFTALELAISSFTAAIDESEYPASMRRPPRHRRGRPRHSRAGRPRRVVEQDAQNQSSGRAQGKREEAHARRAQQGLVV